MLNKAKSIVYAEIRKLRFKAEQKRREADSLDRQADALQKQAEQIK